MGNLLSRMVFVLVLLFSPLVLGQAAVDPSKDSDPVAPVEASGEQEIPEKAEAQEQNPLAEQGMVLSLPVDWKLVALNRDAHGVVFKVAGAPFLFELHVYYLDAEGWDDKPIRTASKLIKNFLQGERNAGLDHKGRDLVKLEGCEGRLNTYQEGEVDVELVSCVSAATDRLYIWRLEFNEEHSDKALREDHRKLFHSILREQTRIVPVPKPAPLVPATEPGVAEDQPVKDEAATP